MILSGSQKARTPDHSKLAEFDLQIEAMINDVAAAETAAGDTGGTTLPESLATSKPRRDKLSEALEAVRAKDEARKKDGVSAAGSVLDGLEQRVITAFAPAKSSAPAVDSPVLREDLTQPVPEELWPKLKLNGKRRLNKSCFVYDADQNHDVCPMGRVLERKDSDTRNGVLTVRYESLDCSGCPLAAECLMKSEGPDACRQMRRDEHEDVRQRTAISMATDAGRAMYDKRSPIVETPFGYLKGFPGHRQFLRKGVEASDTELRWSCISLNMKKMVRYIRRIRQELEVLLDAAPDSVERSEKCPAGA